MCRTTISQGGKTNYEHFPQAGNKEAALYHIAGIAAQFLCSALLHRLFRMGKRQDTEK